MIPAPRSSLDLHRWCQTFPGTRHQVAEARRFVAVYLGDRPETDTAQLIVSELATNALRHTRSGQPDGRFGVALHAGTSLLIISVIDDGGPIQPPTIRQAADDDLTGRGLHLVAELTSRWGVYGDHTSRTVWALLPLTHAP